MIRASPPEKGLTHQHAMQRTFKKDFFFEKKKQKTLAT
jgi:hypothetical protein